jgi:hypothetical protein
LYGLPQQQLRQEIPNFYFSAGKLRHYDLFAHLEAHSVSYDRARHELVTPLNSIDFAMPGLSELLKFLAEQRIEARVLSFGKTDYQMFKYHRLPHIQHLPITVIFEDKDVYLQNQSTTPSILVDDKRTWPLPTWCIQLLYDPKAGDQPVREDRQLWTINSLVDVASVVSSL